MPTDEICQECDGQGWVYDYLGGCGDPECCGGPWEVKCTQCANDWSPNKMKEFLEVVKENWWRFLLMGCCITALVYINVWFVRSIS